MWRDSVMGLPLCSVSSRATSSARSMSRSPSFHSSRPRSRALIAPHGPSSAARAARTAASTSAGPAAGTVAMISSVAGLTTSRVFPPSASHHSPPISIFRASIPVVVMSVLDCALHRVPRMTTTKAMMRTKAAGSSWTS